MSKFIGLFPQSRQYIVDGHENVKYLELASSLQKLKILISTWDNELTVGFSAGPGLFSWHVHIPRYETLDEEIKEASTIVHDIISGKTGIIYSSILGYYPGHPEALEDAKKYQENGEVIELRTWLDY